MLKVVHGQDECSRERCAAGVLTHSSPVKQSRGRREREGVGAVGSSAFADGLLDALADAHGVGHSPAGARLRPPGSFSPPRHLLAAAATTRASGKNQQTRATAASPAYNPRRHPPLPRT